jgi:hypothetical protein
VYEKGSQGRFSSFYDFDEKRRILYIYSRDQQEMAKEGCERAWLPMGTELPPMTPRIVSEGSETSSQPSILGHRTGFRFSAHRELLAKCDQLSSVDCLKEHETLEKPAERKTVADLVEIYKAHGLMSQAILNNRSVCSSLLPSTCLVPTSITMVDVGRRLTCDKTLGFMDLEEEEFAPDRRSNAVLDTDEEDTEVDSAFGEELERIGDVPYNASDCMGQ